MSVKTIFKIICILLLFCLTNNYYVIAYVEEGTEEYNQRQQEAINIIQSVNPTNENEDNYKEYVYIEDNSSKYHYYGCEELTSTPHKIELSEAISKGYYACDKCNPYTASVNEESEEETNYNTVIILLFIVIGLLVIYIIIDEVKYKRNKENKK